MPKVLTVIVIVLLLGGGFYIFKNNVNPQADISVPPAPLSFEECQNFPDVKIIETFPTQCITPDGVLFLQEVAGPVRTDDWQTFDTKLGFSLKCPTGWNCRTGETHMYKYVSIDANHYGSRLTIYKITPENFQDSTIRHPKYQTPVSWLNAFINKNALASQALSETIIPVPGTDALRTPLYKDVTPEEVEEIEVNGKTGVIISKKNHDIYEIVPLNNTDVLTIDTSDPKNPILRSIISSIAEN